VTLPREIAPGIHWLGACGAGEVNGTPIHGHFSVFLLVGDSASLLVDTGVPSSWPVIECQLDAILGDRQLTWIVPTHPEIPHSGSLAALLGKYPKAVVTGDMRDYHLHFPDHAARLAPRARGETLDLGGLGFTFVEAVLYDMPSTIWGFERHHQVMFTSDGFLFSHRVPALADGTDLDTPAHLPGECAMTTSELAEAGSPIDLEMGAFVLRMSIFGNRYIDSDLVFGRLRALFDRYPTRLIAPAHGNVVDDVETSLPVFRAMYERSARTPDPAFRQLSVGPG
jgi:metallo-beta-lactamase superfamily protein